MKKFQVVHRSLLLGGNSNNGTNAGFAYSNSNNAFSISNVNVGARQITETEVFAVVSAISGRKGGPCVDLGPKAVYAAQIGVQVSNAKKSRMRQKLLVGNVFPEECSRCQ